MMIDAETKLCALIGNPVGHSLSPALHNAAFKELGLNYIYLAFQVEDLVKAVAGIRALGIKGVSVTIPHKVQVMEYLDEIDDTAREIGAINTILNVNGRLEGYNSDSSGALKALEDAGVSFAGKRILILGSGGAARAVAFGLAFHSSINLISILGIVEDELKSLGKDLSKKGGPDINTGLLSEPVLKNTISDAEVVINCTPLGMHPEVDRSVIPPDILQKGQVVFDVVYNPLKTKLLREAEEAGCRIVPGIEMFINQAATQFELWTGEKAPVGVMREVVEKAFEK
ncbi:MAG: shikimate dehydrogenase [Deltaproteobacteria bacterium]|nr:MAG: shikimate dehydrogenase [Deltaproteobacteria bacterium]